MQRHPFLRSLFRGLYEIPGARSLARRLARLGIQHSPLSLANRQRIYNFFAVDTAAGCRVLSGVRLPGGGRLMADLDLDEDMSRRWYFWGYTGYELGVPDLLWRLFGERRYQTVIEVGANVGYYTFLLAAAVNQFAPGGMVYVFEPFERVYRQLEQNVALNPRLPVVLNFAAATDCDGEVILYVPASDHAGTNASLVAGWFEQKGGTTVKAVRLDGYCEARGLPRVDLIKMDCEGAEPAVLRGLTRVLEAYQPDVVIEVLPDTGDELDTIFRDTPYRRYLITPDGPRLADRLAAHPQHRDYFLTTTPLSSVD